MDLATGAQVPWFRHSHTLDTFRVLHDHQLADYWAVLDLERLIAEGRGDIVSSAVIVQPSLIIVA